MGAGRISLDTANRFKPVSQYCVSWCHGLKLLPVISDNIIIDLLCYFILYGFLTFWQGLFFFSGLVGFFCQGLGGEVGAFFRFIYWRFVYQHLNVREPWNMAWLPGTRKIQVVIMPAAKNFLPYLHLFAFSFQSLILVMSFSEGLKTSLVRTIFSPGRFFYPVIKLLLNISSFFFFFCF